MIVFDIIFVCGDCECLLWFELYLPIVVYTVE